MFSGSFSGHRIPSDFMLPGFGVTIWENLTNLFIGVAIFIIGMAFRKGYQLQQEQDLTI